MVVDLVLVRLLLGYESHVCLLSFWKTALPEAEMGWLCLASGQWCRSAQRTLLSCEFSAYGQASFLGVDGLFVRVAEAEPCRCDPSGLTRGNYSHIKWAEVSLSQFEVIYYFHLLLFIWEVNNHALPFIDINPPRIQIDREIPSWDRGKKLRSTWRTSPLPMWTLMERRPLHHTVLQPKKFRTRNWTPHFRRYLWLKNLQLFQQPMSVLRTWSFFLHSTDWKKMWGTRMDCSICGMWDARE